MKMSRRAYAEMFGPTVGDRVRLADTELFIEVEQDFTTYGEEVKFGGGKVIRDGMGQSQLLSSEVADTVITNALIIDWWGIVKADVGLKNGRIWKIGKAGNPDIQPNITIPLGAATEVIAGEGQILTAGGIDTHIHWICPQQVETALMSGTTTMIGGGTGPAAGTSIPSDSSLRHVPDPAYGSVPAISLRWAGAIPPDRIRNPQAGHCKYGPETTAAALFGAAAHLPIPKDYFR